MTRQFFGTDGIRGTVGTEPITPDFMLRLGHAVGRVLKRKSPRPAVVIGKVRLLNSASVWFGAVLRGDNEWIEVGEGSNVQDNSTCHTDRGYPLVIGKNCTVGHNVILHGCTIEDGALVGMGSIVMNGARIGRGSIVGAGSVITEGKEYPEHSLIIGSPARVIRTLTPEQVTAMGGAAKFYAINGPRFKNGLKKIG